MASFGSAGENAEFIDELYLQYLRDPTSVDAEWRAFFKGFEFGFVRSETQEPVAAKESLPVVEAPERRHRQRRGDLRPGPADGASCRAGELQRLC